MSRWLPGNVEGVIDLFGGDGELGDARSGCGGYRVGDGGGGEDDGLAGAGGGIRNVRADEDIGAAVLGDLDYFHGVVAPYVVPLTSLQNGGSCGGVKL